MRRFPCFAKLWARFRKSWDRSLKDEGVEYFKTSEYKTLSGQFSRFRDLEPPFGRDGANQVKHRLMHVVKNSPGLTGIGVAMPVSVHDEVMAHPSAQLILKEGDPYSRAFEGVLYKAASSIPRGYMAFAHDDGPDFDRLRALYNSFASLNPETSKKMGGFIPLDDKKHGPLQIADMLANSVMGRFTEQLKGATIDPLEVDFIQISNVFTWTKEFGLAVIRTVLEERGLPVPDDLLSIPV